MLLNSVLGSSQSVPVPGLAPCTKRILNICSRSPGCRILIQPTSFRRWSDGFWCDNRNSTRGHPADSRATTSKCNSSCKTPNIVEANVTCFNRFKVFCPTVQTIKHQNECCELPRMQTRRGCTSIASQTCWLGLVWTLGYTEVPGTNNCIVSHLSAGSWYGKMMGKEKSLRYGKRTAIRFIAWPWHTTKMSNSARALSPQGWTVFQSLKAAPISCGSRNWPCKVLHGNVEHA